MEKEKEKKKKAKVLCLQNRYGLIAHIEFSPMVTLCCCVCGLLPADFTNIALFVFPKRSRTATHREETMSTRSRSIQSGIMAITSTLSEGLLSLLYPYQSKSFTGNLVMLCFFFLLLIFSSPTCASGIFSSLNPFYNVIILFLFIQYGVHFLTV